jgi:hypothetical protein
MEKKTPIEAEITRRWNSLEYNPHGIITRESLREGAIQDLQAKGSLSLEWELIYRVVSQWGNAIEMPNMEGWIKDYAAQRSALLPLPEPILNDDDVKDLDVKDGGLKVAPDLEEEANAAYQKYCAEKGIIYHLMDAANFCLGYMAAKING